MEDCIIHNSLFSVSQHDWMCLSFLGVRGRRRFSVCRHFVCCSKSADIVRLQVASISLEFFRVVQLEHGSKGCHIVESDVAYFYDSNVISVEVV
jgi:hypothetical protein